jgi:hypothetical protein
VTLSGLNGFYPNPTTSNPTSANVPTAYPTDLTRTFAFTNATLASASVTVQDSRTPVPRVCSSATVTISAGPWNVTLNGTTGATGAPAAFTGTIPVGTGYTVKGTKGSATGTLTSRTISAPPATNTFTVTVPGSVC